MSYTFIIKFDTVNVSVPCNIYPSELMMMNKIEQAKKEYVVYAKFKIAPLVDENGNILKTISA